MSSLSATTMGVALLVTGFWLQLIRELTPAEKARLHAILDGFEKRRNAGVVLSGRALRRSLRVGLTIGIFTTFSLSLMGSFLEDFGPANYESFLRFTRPVAYALLAMTVLPFAAGMLVAASHAFLRWPLALFPTITLLVDHHSLLFWIVGQILLAGGGLLLGTIVR